jgi:hypothetical protein
MCQLDFFCSPINRCWSSIGSYSFPIMETLLLAPCKEGIIIIYLRLTRYHSMSLVYIHLLEAKREQEKDNNRLYKDIKCCLDEQNSTIS